MSGQWTSALGTLFRARRVALIGASGDPAKIGGKPVALMKEHFSGRIVPINPARGEIAGLPCKPDIGSLEETPDLAIIALPAKAVEAAIEQCLAAGVRAIVLFTAGFGEINADGLAAQRRIAARCSEAGCRLLGPNSLGYIDFHAGLYATFSAALDNVRPKAGAVGIASQSGAVGSYIMALAAERGIGLSHFIATGNEADIDVADCIDWLADDPATTVIVAYLEGCPDGARLKAALAKARAARKPVIAIKPGASESGQAAVRSHTGALAGSKRVFDAVLRHYGAWPATRIEEAVGIAYACSIGAPPVGDDVTIITPSGGVHLGLADAAAVRAAWQSMMASISEKAPGASLNGALVAPMVGDGLDMIVGARQDPDLGPIVMLGLGGITVEALDDVVIAPAPVDVPEAHAMIGSLRTAALLDGWRGPARRDKDALAKAICALGALAAASPDDLDSIEINPFRVFATGGAALDILVRLKECDPANGS